MHPRRSRRKCSGLSSNVTTGLIVGTFVGIVIIGLVVSYFGSSLFPGGSTTQGEAISFSGEALFDGSNSTASYTSPCGGQAYLLVEMHNNTPGPIHITNVTIYGPSLSHNATTLLSISNNSCLSISQSNPELPPNSDYQFVGYVTVPLESLENCYFLMQFDNGEQISQLLVAQN